MVAAVELQWGQRTHLEVDGVRVHVESVVPAGRSDPAAPVLVGLHGFASGTFTWAGVAPRWADRHGLVAWDRPPFGRSSRPRPMPGPADPYGVGAATRQAATVLTGVDRPVVLVGHSAGTVLAERLARTPPSGFPTVAGVVLIAPALASGPPPLVQRLSSLPGAGTVGAAALRVALRGAEPVIRRVGQHRTPLLDATAAETARMLRRPGTAAALWHLTRAWTPPTPLDALRPLDVPVLVVNGVEDRISPPAMAEEVAGRLGAGLHLLDGVGHAPQEQVPEVMAALVDDFVGGLAR